jgi:hypothetical protein
MFYFRVPGPERMYSEDGKPIEYGWENLHDDFCWPHEVWRSGSADALKAYDEVEFKCVGPKVGAIIAMTDATFEIYVNIITARDKKIGGKNVRAINRLMRPVLEASTTPPDGYTEQPSENPAKVASN